MNRNDNISFSVLAPGCTSTALVVVRRCQRQCGYLETVPNGKSRLQPGLTLIELVVSLVAMSILLAGLASALNVAYLSTPRRHTTSTAALRTSHAMETIYNDLRYATSIQQLTHHSITFKVPDRDGMEPSLEVIEYTWDNLPGSPLIRKFNGESSVLLPSVEEFHLQPRFRTVALPTSYSESEEVMLASYSAFSDLQGAVSGTWHWHGQTLRPQPAGATEWKLTRFRFLGRRPLTSSNPTRIELCKESNLLPADLIETVIIPGDALPLAYTFHTVSFSNCPYLPVGQGVSIVFRAHTVGPASIIRYQKPGASPAPHARIATSSGSTGWQVDVGSSMLFEAWGRYKTANPQTLQHYVNAIEVSLKLGNSNAPKFAAAVQMLNEPELPNP